MGSANEILNGRFNKMLTRLLDVKVPATAVPQVAPEVSPSLDILNITPEYRYLMGETLWSGSCDATGGAGQNSGMRLRHAGDPGVIAVVDQIVVGSPTSQLINILVLNATADLTNVLQAAPRDIRADVLLPYCVFSSHTNVVTQSRGWQIMVPAGGSVVLDNPGVVLCQRPSGTVNGRMVALQITANTVATRLVASVTWRERQMDPAELGGL